MQGVQNAAVSLSLPYERALNTGGFKWLDAKPGERDIEIMNQTYVTPAYLETLRIPVVRGRVFTEADGADAARVIVVNQAFVRKYSPDADPIGRQLGSQKSPQTVVGIVGDIQEQAGWGNFGPVGAVPATYVPAAQTSDAYMTMVHVWFSPSWFVRLARPQEGIVADMQRAVEAVDPLLAVREVPDIRRSPGAGGREAARPSRAARKSGRPRAAAVGRRPLRSGRQLGRRADARARHPDRARRDTGRNGARGRASRGSCSAGPAWRSDLRWRVAAAPSSKALCGASRSAIRSHTRSRQPSCWPSRRPRRSCRRSES